MDLGSGYQEAPAPVLTPVLTPAKHIGAVWSIAPVKKFQKTPKTILFASNCKILPHMPSNSI
jgi:hypothetical protein